MATEAANLINLGNACLPGACIHGPMDAGVAPPVPAVPTIVIGVDDALSLSVSVVGAVPGVMYHIESSTDNGAWTLVWSDDQNDPYETSSVDLEAHTYRYRARGQNVNGFSAWSAIVTTPATPYAPTDLTAIYDSPTTSMTLDWINQSGIATGFQIWAQDNGAPSALISTVGLVETATFSADLTAHQFRYEVCAIKTGGHASGFTAPPAFSKPLAATSFAASQSGADAFSSTWLHAYQNSGQGWADSWEMQVNLNGSGWSAVTTESVLSYWDTFAGTNSGVGVGDSIQFRIRFIMDGKAGAWENSNIITWV